MSAVASARGVSRSLSRQLRRFLLGFVVTLILAAVLATAASIAVGLAFSGRVLPGVSVGGVRLGGLDRTAAEARLAANLPSLGAGHATLRVGTGELTVSYADLGRGYDLATMGDAAYAIGRTGNPLAEGIDRLRSLLAETNLPVRVRAYDPAVLDRLAATLDANDGTAAVGASVALASDGTFTVEPSTVGATVDPAQVGHLLDAALSTANPADVTISVPLTAIQPAVSTTQAAAAAAMARAMVESPLPLTAGNQQLSIDPAQLTQVVRFGPDAAGVYAPYVEGSSLASVVATVATSIDVAPRDASYKVGSAISVVPAITGRSLDQATAETEIRAALEARASGGDPGPVSLPVVTTQPAFTTAMATASVRKVTRISSWTTYYVPGIANGYGANISIPANKLNGFVVAPGATFDFWTDIGPVTAAEGYRQGGVIVNGHSEETGALAGGICSTSTTLFNAALRAGYQMGARTNHYYYIARYPVGLDATVYADGASVTTMSWTNDTDYPVIIRSSTGYGYVRFDLYSVPTGRTVTLTTPIITNRTYAHDVVQYTTALRPGQEQRVEWVTNGFDAEVTRYVRDASGKLIHTDQYFSHYAPVNGLLLIGKAATSSATPSASPTPTPAPASP